MPLTRCVERGELEPVFAYVEQYESFEDWPWPLIYRELDERFPGSKFILTTRRDAETWIRSLKNHATLTGPTEFRRIAYGFDVPHGREVEHIERYRRHNEAIREYFRDRPGDLLELCWETGSGWAELCAFLGKEVPDLPVPHTNRSADKKGELFWKRAQRILHRATFRTASGE
jgi:hypothetical protein